MKLEQLLKIYWSKGLYFSGKLHKIDWTLKSLFKRLNGLKLFIKLNFIKRFELTCFLNFFFKLKNLNIKFYFEKYKILNIYFSKIISLKHNLFELIKINILRLYLIKTYRGRAQALGKPSKGQRTWSNAWNAFKLNTVLKNFITSILKIKKSKLKIIKKDYKKIQRKQKKQIFKIKLFKILTKKNLWF